MRSLFKKLFRDILKSKGQFISIVLVIAVGIAFFVGMSVAKTNVDNSISDFYEDYKYADLWAYFAGIDDSGIQDISRFNEVKNVEGRYKTEAFSLDKTKELIAYTLPENNSINIPHLISGKLPANDKQILVFSEFAKNNDLAVGSKLKIIINGTEKEYEISGFCISPEYTYPVKDASVILPDNTNFGYIYLHHSAIDELTAGANLYNEVLILKADGVDINTLTNKLETVNGYLFSLSRDKQASYNFVKQELKSLENLTTSMPILFFLVSALLIFISQSRMINSERNQIGIMKALGTKKSSILFHYLMFSVISGLFGGIVGSLLGIALQYAISQLMSSFFLIPSINIEIGLTVVYMLIGTGLAVGFGLIASYLSARKFLSENAAQLMRPLPPKNAKTTFIEKKEKIWNKISFKNKLIIRNVLLNKKRTIMGSVGVIFGCGLIIAAISLMTTFQYTIDFQYKTLQTYDMQVILDSPTTIDDISKYNSDVISNITGTATVSTVLGNDQIDTTTIVLPKTNTAIKLVDKNGKVIDLKDGIVITEKLANTNNIHIGDNLSVRLIYDNTAQNIELPVTDIALSYLSQGAYLSFEILENKGVPLPMIYSFYVSITESENASTVKSMFEQSDGVNKVYLQSEIISSFKKILEPMNQIIMVMIVASAILTLAVIFNLTSINIFERRRDIATLKVLGYHKKEVEKLILFENLIITALGAIIGIFAGFLMQLALIKVIVTHDMDFPFKVSVWGIFVAIIAVFGFTIIANLLLKKRIKNVNMVESLKSVE